MRIDRAIDQLLDEARRSLPRVSPLLCRRSRKFRLLLRVERFRKASSVTAQRDIVRVQVRSRRLSFSISAFIRSSGGVARPCRASHVAINLRRNFRGLDFAAPAPENVGVGNRNAAGREMLVDGALVLEQQRFVGAVRDRHDVDVLEFRARFAPVTVGQNVMPSDFAARFDFAARRHGPMKERVEARHAHAARRRLHVLEKSGESSDDFAAVQRFGDPTKFFERNACFRRARAPRRRLNFFRREFALQARAGRSIRVRSTRPTCTGAIVAGSSALLPGSIVFRRT